MIVEPVLFEFVFCDGGGVNTPLSGDGGCGQAQGLPVKSEPLADGPAWRTGIIAEKAQNGRPRRERYRMVAGLPVVYCCLIDAEGNRNVPLQEVQVHPALADVIADGLRMGRITIRLWPCCT